MNKFNINKSTVLFYSCVAVVLADVFGVANISLLALIASIVVGGTIYLLTDVLD